MLDTGTRANSLMMKEEKIKEKSISKGITPNIQNIIKGIIIGTAKNRFITIRKQIKKSQEGTNIWFNKGTFLMKKKKKLKKRSQTSNPLECC